MYTSHSLSISLSLTIFPVSLLALYHAVFWRAARTLLPN